MMGEGMKTAPQRLATAVIWIVSSFCLFLAVTHPGLTWAKEGPPIRIGSTSGLYAGLIFLAEERGMFAQQGLSVEILPATSGVAAAKMLTDGSADFIMITEMVAVNMVLSGEKLAIVASTAEFINSEIIARRDRGILTPQDLKGKRVGVVPKGASEYFMLSYLAANGLTMEDLMLVSLPSNQHVESVVSGTVDAVVTWSPHSHRASEALKGNQSKFWLMAGRQTNLPVARDIERLVKVLVEAAEFINHNPDEAKKIICKMCELPEKDAALDWERIRFNVGLPRELLNVMEFQAKWTIAYGDDKTTPLPDFLEHFYFSALEKVQPGAVTILH